MRLGRAEEVVRAAAAATDADLVVMTSRHMGASSRFLGSVSRGVASIVHRPILVVPVASAASLDRARGEGTKVSVA